MITVNIITSDGSTLIAEQGCSWYDISSAVVKQTLNEVSSATLKFPSSNQRVRNILGTNRPVIEVLDDGARVFYGAVVNSKVDIWDNVEFNCDGALSFLSDIVKDPFYVDNKTPAEYIETIIGQYNAAVSAERQVAFGGVIGFGSGNVDIHHSDEYTDTLTLLKEAVDIYGGYIYETFGSGSAKPSIGWTKDPAIDSGKIIDFGVNEIALTNQLDFSEYASRVYAKGSGSLSKTAIDQDAEAAWGRRDMAYKSNADTQGKLDTEVLSVILAHSTPIRSIDVTALDLTQMGLQYSGFALGTTATLIERRSGRSIVLMVNTVERDLMSPQNSKIVLGRAPITLTSSI